MLREMGAEVEVRPGALRIRGGELDGCDLDLNATPDALPAMAITACFAEGTTRLLNVPQARMKETDRIAVMAEVINDLGGEAEELPDGLVVRGAGLKGGRTSGHGDHRVVMACGLAGLAATGPVEATTAEAVAVTFPDYAALMNAVGAKISLLEA
jgi:3-phosphoshikimate 1-carboxyvinyltransferase